MIVKIVDYDHQGRGIAKIDNKVVFIPNAIIGEEVDIEITKSKKNFMEGKVLKYINKSKDRVENLCPYYNRCGGCDILHLSYAKQLEYKENKIKNICNKYLKMDIKINPIVASLNQFNYRNKVTFQVKNKMIGFFDKKSSNIIKIDKCLLINDLLNKEIGKLKTNKDKIVLRTNGIEVLNNYQNKIICNIGEYKYYVSLASFFQVNNYITEKLYNKVLEYVAENNNETLLDLYCGAGTIGIYVSKNVKKVIGIEINEFAINDANKNKELNNINNIEFICGDIKDALKETKVKPGIIIVDPPRNGLEAEAINQIMDLNAKKIIYVSCDPMTLSRDLNILSNKYDINEITPFDMFPNTYHVETVTVLNCKK